MLFISKFQHEHYFDLYFLGIFLRNIFLLNWFHKRIGISITIMWDMLMRWFVLIFLFHVMWFILYVLLVVVILHIHIWWTCFVILPIHCFVILPIHGGCLLILRLLLFFVVCKTIFLWLIQHSVERHLTMSLRVSFVFLSSMDSSIFSCPFNLFGHRL